MVNVTTGGYAEHDPRDIVKLLMGKGGYAEPDARHAVDVITQEGFSFAVLAAKEASIISIPAEKVQEGDILWGGLLHCWVVNAVSPAPFEKGEEQQVVIKAVDGNGVQYARFRMNSSTQVGVNRIPAPQAPSVEELIASMKSFVAKAQEFMTRWGDVGPS